MATEPDDSPGLITRPPYFVLGAVALALALEWLLPLGFLAAPSVAGLQSWIGLAVLVAGFVVAIVGNRTFRRAGTNVDPFRPALLLVTHGPYRFTRNPMYLGMVLALLGFSLMLALEWGLVLTPLLWLALDRLVVTREEAYLTRKFGEPYREFLGRTRRWI